MSRISTKKYEPTNTDKQVHLTLRNTIASIAQVNISEEALEVDRSTMLASHYGHNATSDGSNESRDSIKRMQDDSISRSSGENDPGTETILNARIKFVTKECSHVYLKYTEEHLTKVTYQTPSAQQSITENGSTTHPIYNDIPTKHALFKHGGR